MESTQPTPTLPEKYYEPDQILKRLRKDVEYRLLKLDGNFLEEKIFSSNNYNFHFSDRTRLPKRDCIGAFPPGYETLIVSTNHPPREVPSARKKRLNFLKLWELYPEHRLGRTLKVILANGWELVGSIEKAGQFYVALRLSETVVIYLYRHAIIDFEWVGGEPPPLSEEQAQQTKQQRLDLSLKLPSFAPRLKKSEKWKKGQIQATPGSPSAEPMSLLLEAIKEEVIRTMTNAKLKIVLREIPSTLRELGDIVWIPIQNQPTGLPKGIELSSISVDLVVSKKMWAGAMKKAQELKQQSGPNVLYIFEAMIGSFQNRLAAFASGVQVAEAKPKVK